MRGVFKKHFDPTAKKFVAALHERHPRFDELDVPAFMLMVSTLVLFLTDGGRLNRLHRPSGTKAGTRDAQA